MDALMMPSEVAAILRVPEATLAIWRSTGRVRLAYVKIGRAVRYRRIDIDLHLAANTRSRDAL